MPTSHRRIILRSEPAEPHSVSEACIAARCSAQHTRSALLGREVEVGFEVTALAWPRLSSSVEASRVGEERIVAFRFARPTKSYLTEQWLAMRNRGRHKKGQAGEALAIICEEA